MEASMGTFKSRRQVITHLAFPEDYTTNGKPIDRSKVGIQILVDVKKIPTPGYNGIVLLGNDRSKWIRKLDGGNRWVKGMKLTAPIQGRATEVVVKLMIPMYRKRGTTTLENENEVQTLSFIEMNVHGTEAMVRRGFIPRSPQFVRFLYAFMAREWPDPTEKPALDNIRKTIAEYFQTHYEIAKSYEKKYKADRMIGIVMEAGGDPWPSQTSDMRGQRYVGHIGLVHARMIDFVGNRELHKDIKRITVEETKKRKVTMPSPTPHFPYIPQGGSSTYVHVSREYVDIEKSSDVWHKIFSCLAFQVLHALATLSSIGIIHADLKSENIVYRYLEKEEVKPLYLLGGSGVSFLLNSLGMDSSDSLAIDPFRFYDELYDIPIESSIPDPSWRLPPELAGEWEKERLPLIKFIDFGNSLRVKENKWYPPTVEKSQKHDAPLPKNGDGVYSTLARKRTTDLVLAPEGLTTKWIQSAKGNRYSLYGTSDVFSAGMLLYQLAAGGVNMASQYFYEGKMYPDISGFALLKAKIEFTTDTRALLNNIELKEVVQSDGTIVHIWVIDDVAALQELMDGGQSKSEAETTRQRGNLKRKSMLNIPNTLQSAGARLIRDMLEPDPFKRKTARELLMEHCLPTGLFHPLVINKKEFKAQLMSEQRASKGSYDQVYSLDIKDPMPFSQAKFHDDSS